MNQSSPPDTMAALRGRDYVAAWPDRAARQLGMSPEWIAVVLVNSGRAEKAAEYDLRRAFMRGEYTEEIASLTPEAAKDVLAALRTVRSEIDQAAKTHCGHCGLRFLPSGECPSCGWPF